MNSDYNVYGVCCRFLVLGQAPSVSHQPLLSISHTQESLKLVNTTPNKEIVRRVCILHGADECFLLVKTGCDDIHVLTNIEDTLIDSCKQELKNWAGMDFKVLTMNSDKTLVENIIQNGEKILPIEF